MPPIPAIAITCLAALGPLAGYAVDPVERFAEAVSGRVGDSGTVPGDSTGWFFLNSELKHLAKGRFWTKEWADVAENEADPVPVISSFNQALQSRGIRLVVVPVPPKASIYPDRLIAGFGPDDVADPAPFYERLLEEGINVLDLRTRFLEEAASPEAPLVYCRQDAHYSPSGIEMVADLILENQGMEPVETSELSISEPSQLTITGDLIANTVWEEQVPGEKLPIRYVARAGEPIEPDPRSRILVLGDSHVQVFHSGDEVGRHCRGAGLADHLSHRMGTPVDVVAVAASGLVQARKALFARARRNPGYWDGKQLVVWVFSLRELTQSGDKPVDIPLE